MQTSDQQQLEERMREIAREELAAYFEAGETVLGEVVEVDGPREVARQEIASLAALMLQRGAKGPWGEALADFSGRTDTGQEPGKE